jgi:hypothetical protein
VSCALWNGLNRIPCLTFGVVFRECGRGGLLPAFGAQRFVRSPPPFACIQAEHASAETFFKGGSSSLKNEPLALDPSSPRNQNGWGTHVVTCAFERVNFSPLSEDHLVKSKLTDPDLYTAVLVQSKSGTVDCRN